MFKREKGITLVALVITIVILLILAGVALNLTIGENGLITKAKDTGNVWDEAVANDQRELNNLANKIDEIIEGTVEEKEWTIAWVYKNSNWSNPYFKDQSLKNNFDFSYEDEDGSSELDENYSLNSETELVGDIVVKLYADGELSFSGTGPIVIYNDTGYWRGGSPWVGYIHKTEKWGGSEYSEYRVGGELTNYLDEHIQSIVIGEGITSIPERAFAGSQATSVSLPSSLESVHENSFLESSWLYTFDDNELRYQYPGTAWYDPWCVDVQDAGGHTWRLVEYYDN